MLIKIGDRLISVEPDEAMLILQEAADHDRGYWFDGTASGWFPKSWNGERVQAALADLKRKAQDIR